MDEKLERFLAYATNVELKTNGMMLNQYLKMPALEEYAPLLIETAIENNGMALKFVPKELRTYDLCLSAVNQDGVAIRYVPIELLSQENHKLIEVAFNQNIQSLTILREHLKLNGVDHKQYPLFQICNKLLEEKGVGINTKALRLLNLMSIDLLPHFIIDNSVNTHSHIVDFAKEINGYEQVDKVAKLLRFACVANAFPEFKSVSDTISNLQQLNNHLNACDPFFKDNIIPVFNVSESNGKPTFKVELIQGSIPPLQEFIDRYDAESLLQTSDEEILKQIRDFIRSVPIERTGKSLTFEVPVVLQEMQENDIRKDNYMFVSTADPLYDYVNFDDLDERCNSVFTLNRPDSLNKPYNEEQYDGILNVHLNAEGAWIKADRIPDFKVAYYGCDLNQLTGTMIENGIAKEIVTKNDDGAITINVAPFHFLRELAVPYTTMKGNPVSMHFARGSFHFDNKNSLIIPFDGTTAQNRMSVVNSILLEREFNSLIKLLRQFELIEPFVAVYDNKYIDDKNEYFSTLVVNNKHSFSINFNLESDFQPSLQYTNAVNDKLIFRLPVNDEQVTLESKIIALSQEIEAIKQTICERSKIDIPDETWGNVNHLFIRAEDYADTVIEEQLNKESDDLDYNL